MRGIIHVPSKLTPEAARNMVKHVQGFIAGSTKVLILDGGVTFTPWAEHEINSLADLFTYYRSKGK